MEEGKLPEGWACTTLGELVPKPRPKIAADPKSPLPFVGMDHIEPGSFHLIGQAQFCDMKSSGSYFLPGDMLYGRLRPYLNKVHRAKFEGVASAEFIVLPSTPDCESDFLKYLLHRRHFVDFAMSRTSGDRPRVKFDAIADYEVALPPLNEQRRIVDKIDTLFAELDQGEAELRKVQTLLARYRQSVLKAAVTGELTADWRARNAHRLESGHDLLTRILDARRQNWQGRGKYKEPVPPDTTDLRQLPEGWEWARVDTLGEVQLGRQRSPKHHAGDFMRPYLRVANVFEDRIDTTDVMSMNFTPEEFKRYALKRGDVLLNEGQSKELVGRPAIYRNEVPGACFTNTLVRFQTYGVISSEYALLVFLHYLQSGEFQKIAKITTNIAHLGAGRFAEMGFPVPPVEEQEEILARAEEQLGEAAKMVLVSESELTRSTALRQSILKDAFAGKLVPQDPADEPASMLLARIRAGREAASTRRK